MKLTAHFEPLMGSWIFSLPPPETFHFLDDLKICRDFLPIPVHDRITSRVDWVSDLPEGQLENKPCLDTSARI